MTSKTKIGLATALLGAAAAAVWAARDYRKWRSLGPGGLPANVGGWVKMRRFRWKATHGLDLRKLMALVEGGTGFWEDLRRRPGARPAVSPYPIPHRQLEQLPGVAMRARLGELFAAAVAKHGDLVEYRLSHYETRHPAITLRDATGKMGARAFGEIAHIHPSDSSMHMVFSPVDAVAAIEMGWGERHTLAGLAAGLPEPYVMVYGPRDEADLAAVGELLEAAVAYAASADVG